MSITDLIEQVRSAGGTLALTSDGRITLDGPREVKERFIPILKAKRAELMTHLKNKDTTTTVIKAPCGSTRCGGCYDVGGGVSLHPPRSGQYYETQEFARRIRVWRASR